MKTCRDCKWADWSGIIHTPTGMIGTCKHPAIPIPVVPACTINHVKNGFFDHRTSIWTREKHNCLCHETLP